MNTTYIKAQFLLGVAIITAIAFVGCIYEISSGSPDWGMSVTWTILISSLPLSIFCFVVAVKLAKESMGNS